MYHMLLLQPVAKNITLAYRGHLGDNPSTIDFLERLPIAMLRVRPSPLGFSAEVEVCPFEAYDVTDDDSMDNVVDLIESGERGDDGQPWSFEIDT